MPALHASRLLRLLLLCLLVFLTSVANAPPPPPPYAACSGLAEGDPCEPYSYDSGSGCSACNPSGDENQGVCRLNESCTDSPDTEVNECLYCS